ncbi:MAG: hypothetical protein E7164_03620 [Firmicutes bacterium]|nr:hypothetical protein [Bacillota bacterium]
MNNKLLIRLIVPEIDSNYDLFIPVNVRVGTIIKLINKSLAELTNGIFEPNNKRRLYDSMNPVAYDVDLLVRQTNIRNGSNVIFL